MSGYTPMMQQYLEIKKQYQYCLLFYRLGDFYELFFEDAKIASKELELTLTGKDCGVEERAPMCGVPFHSADGYIAKLIQKGYKVAVCEQTEDPKQAKGLVKRDVIRIVTPGTVLDTNVLDESKNNYIVSICKNGDGYGIAGCDVTTGEFTVQSFSENESGKILDEIARINPSEIICNEQFDLREKIKRAFELESNDYNRWCYDYQSASICLCNHFGTLNLEGFGIEGERAAVSAAGALMAYLLETQKNALKHISTLRRMTDSKAMVLDASSRKNLELTATLKDGSKRGSLLWVLDKTKSALGARRLRKWVESPLISKDRINQRLDAVQALTKDPMATDRLRESLGKIYDIERLMTKTVYGTCNARDLVSLKCSFSVLPEIKSVLDEFDCEQIKAINDRIDPLEDVFALIDKHIAEEPPFSVREGGLIKKGVSPELDELRSAKSDGTKWLMELENTEKEKTGIKNLRVRFNKVFGYYIEVTNSYKDLVPDYYTRKQTLVNAERYITPELKQIEDKIIGADEKITVLEYDLFAEIRDKVAAQTERISRAAAAVSAVDALASLASVALSNNYVRPNITEERIIDVKEGRHPVVEKMTEGSFIPNDIYLNGEDKRIDIITGPNMAGKSTYMRQCALIVLMAQTGSFVPAESAVIGITDRIFTRVGASDNLATGQSTFMVEMNEV
ncbi:MAG TPA: DNA mismatch repair protein MutS, partial [Lachnospiraceae bacterium]|nr:DNA mismatch repair protein MutS [Lachnospiraceae bacterium]